MLSNIKAYQLETASQCSSSQNSPLRCTRATYLLKDHFRFLPELPCLLTFTRNALFLLTEWFGGSFKPNKWINKSSFMGLDGSESYLSGERKLLLEQENFDSLFKSIFI